jgi:hypothetical protein
LVSVAIVLAATLASRARAQGTAPAAASNSTANAAALDEAAEKVYRVGASLSGVVAPPPTALVVPASPPPAVAPPPPAVAPAAQTTAVAKTPEVLDGFFLALDFETLGFFEFSGCCNTPNWVAPLPELVVGQGTERFRYALLLGDLIGKAQGYTAGLRLAGGWEARPVGYQLGVDLQFSYVPGAIVTHTGVVGGTQQNAVDFTGSVNLVDVTYRYRSVLFELRAVSVGESYDLANGAFALSVGGGVAASWFP